MGLGKKTIDLITENPFDVKKEIDEKKKQKNKELFGTVLEYAWKIAKIYLSK